MAARSASSLRWRRCRTRASAVLSQIKQDLGFRHLRARLRHYRLFVLRRDAGGSADPIRRPAAARLYAGYQVDAGANEPRVTVPLNDNIDYAGGIVTDRQSGGRPAVRQRSRSTLNLDILESVPQLRPMQIVGNTAAVETVRKIIDFQRALVGKRRVHRSALAYYYLPNSLRLFRPNYPMPV